MLTRALFTLGHSESCIIQNHMMIIPDSFVSYCLWPLTFQTVELNFTNIHCETSELPRWHSIAALTSKNPSLRCAPKWAHLCVCLSDWVLFNRPDLKTTCWTSQGRRITCWKWYLGLGSVHKYTQTDARHIDMHLHICFHESCSLCFCMLNFQKLASFDFTLLFIA